MEVDPDVRRRMRATDTARQFYTKETSRMKTSLDTTSSHWTYQHQEKTQRQDIKKPMEEDKWLWTQNLEDICEDKPD